MLSWLMLLVAGSALAADDAYYIEGPALDARRDAAKMARAADDRGFDGRVVRRFARGSGWRFVLVVEGFEDEQGAMDAAAVVAGDVGTSLTVYQTGDGQATRLAEVEPTVQEGGTPSTTTGVSVEDVLSRAVAAHGGSPHPVHSSDSLLFRFRRELPDGLRAVHTVVRRGSDLHVEVQVEAGDGKSSRAWIVGEQAWLSVEGAEAEAQEAVWAREQLAAFLPGSVLALPVGLGEALEARRELQELYADGTARSGDTQCLVLKYDGDQVSAPLGVFLQEDSLLIRRVVSGVDARNYDDYRSIRSGVVAPFRVDVTREGTVVDSVEVLTLELEPEMDEAWFSAGVE